MKRFPQRNKFISEHIFANTNVRRTPKQVGSRLQQLRATCLDMKSLSILHSLFGCLADYFAAVQGLICGTHLLHGEALESDPSFRAPVPRQRRKRPACPRREVPQHNPSDIAADSKTCLGPINFSIQAVGKAVDKISSQPPTISNLGSESEPAGATSCRLWFVDVTLESAPWPSPPPTLNLISGTPSSMRLATVSDQVFHPHSRILFGMNPMINFTSPSTLTSECTFTVFCDDEESPVHYEVAPVAYHQPSRRYSTNLVPKLWNALCTMPREAVCVSFIRGF